jgi:hypothetical protein
MRASNMGLFFFKVKYLNSVTVTVTVQLISIRSECYCGSSYGSYGLASATGRVCDMSCSINFGQICGGGFANSIYLTDPNLLRKF